jgi:gluconolactonase
MFLSTPTVIETEVFTELPAHFRRHAEGKSRPINLLEGPSFDTEGNLYCVDIPCGRIYRISPDAKWELVLEYDGNPNGLKIHKDGRLFVADRKNGLMIIDSNTGNICSCIAGPTQEKTFLGLNDLVFARNGAVFFTDQGQSGLQNPNGSVYRINPVGKLDLIVGGIPSPNGLVFNARESELFVAVTRANAIWRVELHGVNKAGVFVQLPASGPDGLALDEQGNVAVAVPGPGVIIVYSKWGEPLWVVKSCRGTLTTNIAYGGDAMRELYIVESWTSSILVAHMPIAGKPMYSHA